MDIGLQKKLYELLITVPGITEENLFYMQADPDSEKVFPRIIYSEVSNNKNYDTEQEFSLSVVQISLFCYYQPDEVEVLKLLAISIQDLFTIHNLGGMEDNLITRSKLNNIRESQFEGIFQIDLSFFLDLSRRGEDS